ncbi:MAG: hypothetical protein KGY38_01575 [Desulfobacterales bacterium]|nr:hypothetical protein [Desulfobacterales bacterium]
MNSETATKIRSYARILKFYTVKLPFVYLMIPVGFIFEYLVTLPYIVLVSIDERRQTRNQSIETASGRKDPDKK